MVMVHQVQTVAALGMPWDKAKQNALAQEPGKVEGPTAAGHQWVDPRSDDLLKGKRLIKT